MTNLTKKNTILLTIISFATLIIAICGATFAYFTAKVIGNDEAKDNQVYAGIMSLKLDGTQELNANNMLPGASREIEFSVENTGTLTTTYELDMKNVTRWNNYFK